MTKAEYLKKFSFFARWYLPAAEAGDVIGDYTEMLHDRPEPSTLAQELGAPRQAAKLLAEKKVYRRWLFGFSLMLLCLLIPSGLMLRGWFYRRPFRLMFALLTIGSTAAILWFRPKEKTVHPSLPKGLLPALAALIAAGVIATLILAGLANGVWEQIGARKYGVYASLTLRTCGTLSMAAAFFGLIKARTHDRRWRALYTLGLTALILCTLVIATLHGMDLDVASYNFLRDYMIGLNRDVIGLGIFGLVGLAATGVALC